MKHIHPCLMIGGIRWKHRVVYSVLLVFVLSASLLAVSKPVQAEQTLQTVYVDVGNADDPYENGSHDHPFDRIQEGVDYASPGDTILVAEGVYYEEVVISRNKSGISLVAEGKAVIDGEGRGNSDGIRVAVNMVPPEYLDNVKITGFTVQNCVKGITLMRCRNAVLRNNTMIRNLYGFSDYAAQASDVDTSNTVDGKPIYYWVDQHDKTVPLDAGYVVLANSSNIIIKDLNLTGNGQGIFLKNSAFNRIENVSVQNNQDGIIVDYGSVNNTVIGNMVAKNAYLGIYVSASSGNLLLNNTVSDNYYGIYLASDRSRTIDYGVETINNIVEDNTIQGSWKGVVMQGEIGNPITDNVVRGNMLSNNTIAISASLSAFYLYYHNNIINNGTLIENEESENIWDYLGQGNYWSTYNGTDTNNDCIGDLPFIIDENNKDNFPLIGIFEEFSILWGDTTFTIPIITTNPTISNFHFIQSEKNIAFDIMAETSQTHSCRVTIPKVLLGGPYEVHLNGLKVATLIEESNETHAFLLFTYESSSGQIEIFGATVIPEFSPAFLALLLVTTGLLAVSLRKHALPKPRIRHQHHPKN